MPGATHSGSGCQLDVNAFKFSAPPHWMKDPDVYSSIPYDGHRGGEMDRSALAGTYIWHWRDYSKRSRPSYYQQNEKILSDERAQNILATDSLFGYMPNYLYGTGPYYRVRHMTTLYIDGHVEHSLDDPLPFPSF